MSTETIEADDLLKDAAGIAKWFRSLADGLSTDAKHLERVATIIERQSAEIKRLDGLVGGANTSPKAVVYVEGGVVQGIVTDIPMEVAVVDYDVEYSDPEDQFEMPQGDGKTAPAVGSRREAEIDPARVVAMLSAVDERSPVQRFKP